MSLPLRSDVHVVNVRRSVAQQIEGSSQGASQPGAQTSLVAASALQTVYACQVADHILAAVRLDGDSRSCITTDASLSAPVLGIIARKPTPTSAVVVTYGPVEGFEGLIPKARYFLDANGTLCCPPLAADSPLYVHPVGVATSPTQLFVTPQWPKIKRDI